MLDNIAMSSTGDEAELSALPASGGDHSNFPVTSSPGSLQSLDMSKLATSDTRSLVNKVLEWSKCLSLRSLSLRWFTVQLSSMRKRTY